MLAAAVSFAVMAASIKQAGGRLGTLELVFFRTLVAYLLIVLFEKHRGRSDAGNDRKGLWARALFGYVALVLYTWAIKHVDLGIASAMNQSSPIFVALFSFLFLKESVPRNVLLLVVVAFLGVVLVLSPDFTRLDAGAAVGFCSAAFAAMAYLMVRKLRNSERPLVIVRWYSLICAAFSAPLMLVEGFVFPSLTELGFMFLSGLTGLAGQLFMTYSYRYSRAALVSPFLYFAIPVSLLIGLVCFSEWPDASALTGVAVLVAASVLIGRVLAGGRPNQTDY